MPDKKSFLIGISLAINIILIVFLIGQFVVLANQRRDKTHNHGTGPYFRRKYKEYLDCKISVEIGNLIQTHNHTGGWAKITQFDFIYYDQIKFPNKDSLLSYLDLVFYKDCKGNYYYPTWGSSSLAEAKLSKIYFDFEKNEAFFVTGERLIRKEGIRVNTNWKYTYYGDLPECPN